MHHWQSKNAKSSTADDLVLLSKINHQTITENLRKRFLDDNIYTYIGNVLISINPYKPLSIFTKKEVDIYQGAATYENAPHIYALADNMYRDMLIDYESQCVIISGESGAGKTVSAKLIMEYISKVSGSGGNVEKIKEIILESNPLLEAFGNAKTVRNNNSSRFGKYVEIPFDRGGQPIGGKVSQFLFEKSRVVLQNQNERNFHIFYQLLEGVPKKLKDMLGLSNPEYYSYLNQTGVYRVDDSNDQKDFQNTMHAMEVMSINEEERESILSLVAAVLHLGNIIFKEGKQHSDFKDKNSLKFPCFLLGLDEESLKSKMVSREMTDATNRQENIIVTFNKDQSFHARDALAKALYSRMFDFIVNRINEAMTVDDSSFNIGILDIYGFEIFAKNGFEQFCINYVNEKLQQIFIELTLKAEQEEYQQEGVEWTPVNYFNNKVVCDMIELRQPPGIYSILDDVCVTAFKVIENIDSKFVCKMDSANLNQDHYLSRAGGFTIFHYAGKVSYDCEGFCDRNRDQLNVDIIEMMQYSTDPFIVSLFPENIHDLKNKRTNVTVGNIIRRQANDLVTTLMKCQPHYIRCIKPNETKRPRDWDNERVIDQVTYLGLRENIIVRRAGFAYRRPFLKFLQRYAILTKETWPKWSGDPVKGIKHLMTAADINKGQWQIGRTKLFIKDPESLFLLEERRERKFNHYAKIIQKFFLKATAAKRFLQMKQTVAELFYNKKERREHSINRNFFGDYLYLDENPQLRILVGKREKIEFASYVLKYDRRFKKVGRDIILTDKYIYLIGREKVNQGELKGQFVEVIKRKLPIENITCLTLSALQDNFVVLSIEDDYESVLEIDFKTEFVMVLSKRFQDSTKRPLNLRFNNMISFKVKSEGFMGGTVRKITFVSSTVGNSRKIIYKVSGPLTPSMVVNVPRGLPSNSKPGNRDLRSVREMIPRLQQHGIKVKSSGKTSSKVTTRNDAPIKNPRREVNKVPSKHSFGSPRLSPPKIRPVMGSEARKSHITDEEIIKSAVVKESSRVMNTVTPKRVPPPKPPRPAKLLPKVRALYNFDAQDTDELSIRVGDIIELVKEDNIGWCTGRLSGEEGLIPSNYVERI